MAPECQAKNIETAPLKRVFGRQVRERSTDPKFVAEVLRRRNEGEALEKIANSMECHRNTVMKILRQNGGDPLDRVHSILREGLPAVASMVMAETIRKKDVRAGVQILTNAGQLDALRPKPAVEDGGRIVIEWSGAPPPWSPAAVLKAYAQRQVEAAVPPQVEPVQIAEVVQNDTNAENSQTG
jgi:hypothetical protein